MEYIDHPSFADVEAVAAFWAVTVPAPDISWYFGIDDEHTRAKHQVLTAEQEEILFLQFNHARKEGKNVLAKEAKDKIIGYNLALVLSMVGKYIRPKSPIYDAVVSQGNDRLVRAAELFDVSRKYKFSTYACRAIINLTIRELSKAKKDQSLKLSDVDMSYDPAREARDKNRSSYFQADRIRTVRAAISRAELSAVETRVITQRFFSRPTMTLEAIGTQEGVTKERIRQIQNKALKKLRESLDEIKQLRYILAED